MGIVAPSGTRWDHCCMAAREPHGPPKGVVKTQRKFYLDERRGEVWDAALAVSGLSQTKAMETIADALELGLFNLMQLRVDVVAAQRAD